MDVFRSGWAVGICNTNIEIFWGTGVLGSLEPGGAKPGRAFGSVDWRVLAYSLI
jgi:hypothetical protein